MAAHSTYRRLIGAAAATVLVTGTALAAHAAPAATKLHTRTVKISYSGGCGIVTPAVVGAPGACVLGDNYDVVRKTGEKYLTIKIADKTGKAVSGEIWLSGGTGNAVQYPFCGGLKNYRMGQSAYTMDLNEGVDATCVGGVATSGTITVTYSNLPVKK